MGYKVKLIILVLAGLNIGMALVHWLQGAGIWSFVRLLCFAGMAIIYCAKLWPLDAKYREALFASASLFSSVSGKAKTKGPAKAGSIY